jgi:protein-tyrosine phosphatase
LLLQKKTVFWGAFGAAAALFALLQFIPSQPVIVPASLPVAEREAHRLLNFEGVNNFRDLGGYRSADGRSVRWGTLYRSGTFADASRTDREVIANLALHALVDFRSSAEKREEPNQLPDPLPFALIEIPTLDGGDTSLAEEVMARIEEGDFDGFDPDAFMIAANRQIASTYTPQYREFMRVVLDADGAPVAWHCSAGKDRTGFAAALLLRALGVPMETVLNDYLRSREPAVAARSREVWLLRLFKGDQAADKLRVLLGVEPAWLEAAFAQIDADWGSFDTYLSDGLGLGADDLQRLRDTLLE